MNTFFKHNDRNEKLHFQMMFSLLLKSCLLKLPNVFTTKKHLLMRKCLLFKLSILPGAPPPTSPSINLSSTSLGPTEILEHDISSESEESSLSFSQPLDECEPVPRALSKKCKRREFLRLLQLSMSGAENRDEV